MADIDLLDYAGLKHYDSKIKSCMWNWQKSKKDSLVQFKPVPESALEPVVDFMFTETPPAEGEKGPNNPSTITGVSSVSLVRCGKNILPSEYVNSSMAQRGITVTKNADGSYHFSGTSASNAEPFIHFFSTTPGFVPDAFRPGEFFTISIKTDSPYVLFRVFVSDSATQLGTDYYTSANGVPKTFTISETTKTLFFSLLVNTGKTIDCDVRCQIERGKTATEWESPADSNYTVVLGDTYYGGLVDVNAGVMTATHAATTPAGETVDISSAPAALPLECTDTYGREITSTDGTSLSVGSSGGTVVYKLATPQTVQIAPQQIKSLPASDKYEPRINTVYSNQQAVQAGYQRYADDPAPLWYVKDMLRAEVEAMTSGRNTVVRDKRGNPHIMVVVPKFRLSDIDSNWAASAHPAFIVDGTEKPEVLIGKFLASQDASGKVQTLPRQAPWTQIDFDSALAACRELGEGFCLNTNAMWAARVLLADKNLGSGHEYLGNRNYGRDSTYHELTGTLKNDSYTPGDTSISDAATLTGTGGEKWTDDETAYGVCDLVGNCWEWIAGLRLVDGEIQVISNNDAALATADLSGTSTEWKAILEDGTLVAPGTAGTLKYDGLAADMQPPNSPAGAFRLNTVLINQNNNGYYAEQFKNVVAYSGVTVPYILNQLALFPIRNNLQGIMNMRNKGESLPFRGGNWTQSDKSGPFALNFRFGRGFSAIDIGFRIAYVA